MNKILKSSGFALMMLLFLTALAFGQASRTIAVGEMEHQAGEQPETLALRWPIGWTELEKGMSGGPNGINIGHKETWTDETGVDWDVRISQAVASKFTNLELVVVPVEGAFKRTFRSPAPDKIVDGTNWTSTLDLGDPVDGNAPADVVTYGKWNSWGGIDVERWAYSFADRDHDDFVIVEWVFTNNSGTAREDVYFTVVTQMNTTSHYPGDLWNNYAGPVYAERLYYMWDADDQGSQEDDKGNPDLIWGNFREPQYMGFLTLHADAAADDETDDPGQPHKAGWSQREQLPSLSEYGHQDIYEYMTLPWTSQTLPDLNLDPTEMYRFRPEDWNEIVEDPLTEQAKPGVQNFGPYQMGNGDDVRIVVAYTAGAISNRLCLDLGRAYDSGYAQRSGNLEPMPYNIPGFDIADKTFSHSNAADKQLIYDIINTGRDSLFKQVDMIQDMWAGANVKNGSGSFGFDLAPPSPSLTVQSDTGQVKLSWGDEADGASGLSGFKIYRSYWRRPELTTPTDTTFILVDEVGAGVHEYVDQGTTTPGQPVIRGESYYYYVTAVANGMESSAFQNRTGFGKSGADKLQEAASPTRPPSITTWQEEVVVVPNPYHVRAFEKYSGRQLKFLNLPGYANIHIYTMTGDLVQTIVHDTGTGDAAWDRQDTFSTMEIVSGVYIFVVEETDTSMNATGETYIGKFVVVK